MNGVCFAPHREPDDADAVENSCRRRLDQRTATADYGVLDHAGGGRARAPLPGYPSDQKLIPFTVSELSGNRFYVDQESIDVDPDRDVRLTVVVDAPGGARTVTHEAIRCQTAEYKILAIGRRDRQWSVLADPQWRRIEEGGPNRQRAALALEYLCDGPTSVLDRDAALRALKASPRTKSFQKP